MDQAARQRTKLLIMQITYPNFPPTIGVVAALLSEIIDLATTDAVDIATPTGTKMFVQSVVVIGETDVTVDGAIDVGIVATPDLYFNNIPVLAANFDDADDGELTEGASVNTAASSVRITPDGTGTGTIRVKIIGILK